MAALERRRAATAVLRRHDRCRLRGVARRSSGSICGHQPAAAGGSRGARRDRSNSVRPFPGYTEIAMRETTAKSQYHGLAGQLSSRGWPSRVGDASITPSAGTTRTPPTTTRGVDDPQNPLDKDAEFAAARHGPHPYLHRVLRLRAAIRSRSDTRLAEAACWGDGRSPGSPGSNQARRRDCGSPTAITTARVFLERCGPIKWAMRRLAIRPACSGSTRRRSSHRLQVSTATRPSRHSVCPAVTNGTSPSPRTSRLGGTTRLQLRADLINAFNQTQFLDVNTCCFGTTTCDVPAPDSARSRARMPPREIQLGVRFNW